MRRLLPALSVLVLLLFAASAAHAQDQPPDCEDFATQAAAQTALRLDPSDPGGLDGAPGRNTVAGPVTVNDAPPHPGDGIACEDNPGTRDEEPVPVGTSSTTTTTGPPTGQGEALPRTGLPVLPQAATALALVGAGALALRRTRYQPRH